MFKKVPQYRLQGYTDALGTAEVGGGRNSCNVSTYFQGTNFGTW